MELARPVKAKELSCSCKAWVTASNREEKQRIFENEQLNAASTLNLVSETWLRHAGFG